MRKIEKLSMLFLVITIITATPAVCHAKYDTHGEQFLGEEDVVRFVKKKFIRYGKVKFIKFNKLKDSELCTRKGKKKVIVDITYGICVNKKGDGKILNPRKGYGNYITYRRLKHCRKGSLVTTYSVYEPWNNSTDGIWYRYDVVTKY